MTFTYTAGTANDLTRIRLRIGDTDSSVAAQLRLEDEEIADLLITEGSFRRSAAAAAEALAAKYARKATEKSVGSASVSYSERFKQLMDLAKALRSGAALAGTSSVYTGGVLRSELDESRADTTLVQPAFRRDQFDNPEALTGAAVSSDEEA